MSLTGSKQATLAPGRPSSLIPRVKTAWARKKPARGGSGKGGRGGVRSRCPHRIFVPRAPRWAPKCPDRQDDTTWDEGKKPVEDEKRDRRREEWRQDRDLIKPQKFYCDGWLYTAMSDGGGIGCVMGAARYLSRANWLSIGRCYMRYKEMGRLWAWRARALSWRPGSSAQAGPGDFHGSRQHVAVLGLDGK